LLPAGGRWVLGGYDPEDWAKQRALKTPLGGRIWTAFGLHPWWVASHSAEELKGGLARLEKEGPDADLLGETGLDQVRPNLDLQREAFVAQLELAKTWKKPLVLHVVKAHLEALSLLAKHGPFPAGGLVHAFNASAEVGEAYLGMGFLLSVGPQVRRDGYVSLKDAIPVLPVDGIVIETDAPDQTPDLVDLIKVAEAVGKLTERSASEVLHQSQLNLEKLLCRE